MSASLAASDTLIRVALLTAQVSLACTALMLLGVLWLHWHHGAVAARRRDFIARWRRPLASIALDGALPAGGALPPLPRRDLDLFLQEWIALHEALDRDACTGLQALSREVGLRDVALRRLRRRRLHDRLVGTIALGHLGDPRDWNALLAEARSPSLPLSLAAARALVRLDPERGAAALMPLIEARDDWPQTRLWPLLREAGPAAVTGPLIAAIRAAPPPRQARLAHFLPLADEGPAGELVHELLVTAAEDRLVGACLAVVDRPAELPAIRRLAAHPRWHIRMFAAKALGRLGERADEALLADLLDDPQWWVRYRAAQALVALPWMRRDALRELQASLPDRFARDALQQAIAERAFR